MSQSKMRWICHCLLAMALAAPALGFAQERGRWTLKDWLEQRDRSRMMDLWLSMNSPSPYEFMLGASYLATTTNTNAVEQNTSSFAGEVRAYAQFVGLTLEHENHTEAGVSDLSGLFNLRLFGDSLQNSALTLHAGQRVRTEANETLRQFFGQISLQMYFTRFFGLDGFYRQYQGARSDRQNAETQATQSEIGLFIDFPGVRAFGALVNESENFTPDTGAAFERQRTGVKSGLKFFY